MEWWKWLIIALIVLGALYMNPLAGILGAGAVLAYTNWK